MNMRDDEIKDLFKAAFETKAPENLMDNVMAEIQKPFEYKPIISRKIWLIIGSIIILFVATFSLAVGSQISLNEFSLVKMNLALIKTMFLNETYSILAMVVLMVTSLWFLNTLYITKTSKKE